VPDTFEQRLATCLSADDGPNDAGTLLGGNPPQSTSAEALGSNRLEALKAIALANIASVSTCRGVSALNGRAAQPNLPMSRSSTIIEERCTMSMPAIYPGEILVEEDATRYRR
jgi:hypothetical protein